MGMFNRTKLVYEYSKTGRNPTNNPTHDLFLIVILADTENKKSSEILEFQSFALICYLLSRCVRDYTAISLYQL